MSGTIRTTKGRGRLYDSILDTVGDTPVIRVNNLAPKGVTIYVKAEFFNPAASVKDRLAVNIMEEAEMNEEEIALSRSTPGFQLAAA